MNPETIPVLTLLTVLTLLSVVAIGWAARTVWREMRGCGEGTEAERQRTELRNSARVKKQLEHWRNGE